MRDGEPRDRGRAHDIGRAAERLHCQGPRHRGGKHGRGIREGVDANNELKRVEGAGKRRGEGGRYGARGAAADEHAKILPAQIEPDAGAGRDRRADLGEARLQPHRGAAAVGDQRLPRDQVRRATRASRRAARWPRSDRRSRARPSRAARCAKAPMTRPPRPSAANAVSAETSALGERRSSNAMP